MSEALLNAANDNNYEECLNIINTWSNNINVNIQNPNGITPMMYGCMRKNILTVNALLLMGANVNIRNDRGQTALMVAIESHDYDIMLLLINAGTNINIKDNNNMSAIDYYRENFNQIHQIHFDRGYDINYITDHYNPFANN